MKIKVTRIDLRQDKNFDPKGLVDDYHAKPCIVKYKKHWWNRWQYIMEDFAPRLFWGTEEEVESFAMRILSD